MPFGTVPSGTMPSGGLLTSDFHVLIYRVTPEVGGITFSFFAVVGICGGTTN